MAGLAYNIIGKGAAAALAKAGMGQVCEAQDLLNEPVADSATLPQRAAALPA